MLVILLNLLKNMTYNVQMKLFFLDITASSDARNTVVDLVRRVAENVFIPFTVGGGIRTVDDFRALLREGADKISINLPPLIHRI